MEVFVIMKILARRNIIAIVLLIVLFGGFLIACAPKNKGAINTIDVDLHETTTIAAGSTTYISTSFKYENGDNANAEVNSTDIKWTSTPANVISFDGADGNDKLSFYATASDTIFSSEDEDEKDVTLTASYKVGDKTITKDAKLKVVRAEMANEFVNSEEGYKDFAELTADSFDTSVTFMDGSDSATLLLRLMLAYPQTQLIDLIEPNAEFHQQYQALKDVIKSLYENVFSTEFQEFISDYNSNIGDLELIKTMVSDALSDVNTLLDDVKNAENPTTADVVYFQSRLASLDQEKILASALKVVVDAVIKEINNTLNGENNFKNWEKSFLSSLTLADGLAISTTVSIVLDPYVSQLFDDIKAYIDAMNPVDPGESIVEATLILSDIAFGSTGTFGISYTNSSDGSDAKNSVDSIDVTITNFDDSIFTDFSITDKSTITLSPPSLEPQDPMNPSVVIPMYDIHIEISLMGGGTLSPIDDTFFLTDASQADAIYHQYSYFMDSDRADFDADDIEDMDSDNVKDLTDLAYIYQQVDLPGQEAHAQYMELKAKVAELVDDVFSSEFVDYLDYINSEEFQNEFQDEANTVYEPMTDLLDIFFTILGDILTTGEMPSEEAIAELRSSYEYLSDNKDQMLDDLIVFLEGLQPEFDQYVSENEDALNAFEIYYLNNFVDIMLIPMIDEQMIPALDQILEMVRQMLELLENPPTIPPVPQVEFLVA